MATDRTELAAIRPDEQYPLDLFMRLVGLGRTAIRQARRNGLRVQYIHSRAFILGRDWLEYCEAESKGSKD